MCFAELDKDGWELLNAEEEHTSSPDTYIIPTREERTSLTVNQRVKLPFMIMQEGYDTPTVQVERMWITIVERKNHIYEGILESSPVTTNKLLQGDTIFE